MLVLESCSRSKQSSTFKLYPNKIKEAFDNFAEEAIGIDFDLQEELVARQKWENYSLEVEESEMFGGYRDLVENVEHALHLKRANGTIEMSNSYVCRDDNDGKVVALHFFQGCDGSLDGLSDTISCFKKFTRSCPFSFELLNVFYEGKSLGLVYELNGGAITMAEALQASVTSGGFISSSKDQEETLMEQWIAQLLWTLQLFHIEAGWFIGSGLLFSPQNILLTSQSTKLLINGLGATQILALSRSPLPYTEAEIIDHQTKDLQALAELIKTFLSGPRRWLLRSPLIAPILAYLDQRGTMAFTSLSDLLELPASSNLLQRLLVRSFKRQDYLQNQMTIQIQSERVLGLLCKLNFLVDRFKSDDSLKSWPSKDPLLGLHQFIFGKKHIPGVPDVDLLHAVGVLRQLDVGSEERLLLSSSESSACFSNSFAELAFYLEDAYQALLGHYTT